MRPGARWATSESQASARCNAPPTVPPEIFELPTVEFLSQLYRVSREEPVRAEFKPLVASGSQFIEEPLPRGLLRVIREPNTPRVRCAAQGDPRSHADRITNRHASCPGTARIIP